MIIRMKFEILTIFPEVINAYAAESILGRGQRAKKISVRAIQLRDFTTDKHHTVDDRPYGGGAGMVMKVEPIYKALRRLKVKKGGQKTKIILTAAGGRPFTQKDARVWAKLKRLVIICGRYEGVDARVAEHLVDEEISIGPYVLTGGEVPAMVIMDAVSRHVPGVLGNAASLKEESYEGGLVKEYPQYTRPEVFKPAAKKSGRKGKEWAVPNVLLSGDHKKITEWRGRVAKSAKVAKKRAM